jgi:hypothetical protein
MVALSFDPVLVAQSSFMKAFSFESNRTPPNRLPDKFRQAAFKFVFSPINSLDMDPVK